MRKLTRTNPKRGSRPVTVASMLAISLATLTGAAHPLARRQSGTCAVLNVSEYALPGQALLVRGSGFTSATTFTITPYSASGMAGSPTTLTPTALAEFGAIVTVPSGYSYGLYRIDASGGSLASSALGSGATQTAYVNLPRIQWSDAGRPGEPNAGSGEARIGTTVRLIGRNLAPDSVTPTVTLTDVTNPSNPALTAAVTIVAREALKYTVPSAAVVGDTYTVTLTTDLAGSASSTTAPETIKILAAGTDPYGLGTAWATDFDAIRLKSRNVKTDGALAGHYPVGDGVTDDRDALQYAIDYAWYHDGGGEVYIPAGTYRVDNVRSLSIHPGVVLRGAGSGSTILKVGGSSRASSYYGIIVESTGADIGIASLSIQNGGTANGVLKSDLAAEYATGPSRRVRRFFMKSCAVDVGTGPHVQLEHLSEAAIEDCSFTSTGSSDFVQTPLYLEGSRNVLFSGNSVSYRTGRLRLGFNYRTVVENNTITVDYAHRSATETGGIEASFGQQILVDGNTIQGVGDVGSNNDGEMLMSQTSNAEYSDLGAVGSATSTSLTRGTSTAWPSGTWLSSNHDELPRSIVALVGKPTSTGAPDSSLALGEWRWITSHDALTATLSASWDVVPDATSRYAVQEISNFQQTWVANSISGGKTGCMIYNGGVDAAISGNTLSNTGGIYIGGQCQRSTFASPATVYQGVLWDVAVRGNQVTSTTTSRAACVLVFGHQQSYSLSSVGISPANPNSNLALGADVRDNAMTGVGGATPASWMTHDGYEVYAVNDDSGTVGALVNWGTILENNTLSSSGSTARFEGRNIAVYGGQALVP